MTASFKRDLVDGIGGLLASAAIDLAYPASTATDGQTGIYAMTVPLAPNRVVVLSPTILGADPSLSMSSVQLQVRSRSEGEDPSDAWLLDESVADVLLGNYPLTLPSGIRISTVEQQSSGSMGQDSENRWHWASNYLLDTFRPGPHRH